MPRLQGGRRRRRHRRRATPARDTSSSYGDALPYPENAARCSPSRCPASTRSSSATRTSRSRSASSPTPRPASRCCSPSRYYWGMRLSPVMDLDLQQVRGQWTVVHVAGARCSTPTPCPRTRSRARRAPPAPPEGRHLRQQRHRDVARTAMSARDVALRGHRRDRLHQLRAGRRGQAGPGRHARGVAAGAVDRRAVQQRRRDPGRRRHDPRRRRALHLRQHAARHQAHRRAGQGLPGVLGASTSSGRGAGPYAPGRPSRTPSPDRAERHAGLQLRHHGRARRRRSPTTSTSPRPVGSAASSNLRTPARPSTSTPRSSSWRSTTTGSPAAATSRASRRRRSSTTARSRSASCSSTGSTAHKVIDPRDLLQPRLEAREQRQPDHRHALTRALPKRVCGVSRHVGERDTRPRTDPRGDVGWGADVPAGTGEHRRVRTSILADRGRLRHLFVTSLSPLST